MEWLVVLAALACPIGMLAMGAIAWVVGKRAGGRPDGEATEATSARAEGEGAATAG